MVKRFTSLLKQIVGGLKMNKVTSLSGLVMACIPLAFFLLLWGSDQTNPIKHYIIWVGAFLVFALAIFGWVKLWKEAVKEDGKTDAERDRLSQLIQDMRGESRGVSTAINTLIREMRQDRDERKRK